MQKVAKQNGAANKENATVKKEVQKKLTDQAIRKTVIPEKKVIVEKPTRKSGFSCFNSKNKSQ